MLFNTLDLTIVALYCVGIIGLAAYVSRQSAGHERTAEDYFLAGRSLPWWAIGASLIAANISAAGSSPAADAVEAGIMTSIIITGNNRTWDHL